MSSRRRRRPSLPPSSPDLFCDEAADAIAGAPPEPRPDPESPDDAEDSIAGLFEAEGQFSPAADYLARFRSQSLDPGDRALAAAWILQAHSYFGFQPETACLSVNYLDRFLSSKCLLQVKGWPIQLLGVACLSLAAKMEELVVPSLLDIQVKAAHIFEPRTIQRMEMLILSALKWRLRSITPFCYIHYFALKVDPSRKFTMPLISIATQIILITIQILEFLDYLPSTLAATAVMHAASEFQLLPSVTLGILASSPHMSLSSERIESCYKLMQDFAVGGSQQKAPIVLPHLRVTTPATAAALCAYSSSSSSSFWTSFNKRRKLNNCFWTDDKNTE